VAWKDLLGHHQLVLRRSLPGSNSRDGPVHAVAAAAARWRENSWRWHGGKAVSRRDSGLDGGESERG